MRERIEEGEHVNEETQDNKMRMKKTGISEEIRLIDSVKVDAVYSC